MSTQVPYGIVYMTSRVFRGEVVKRYIGQHKLTHSQRDGYYLGSGNILLNAIRKHGRTNFVRETLEICHSAKELFSAEEKWIDLYNAVESPDFYNLAQGGAATVKKFCRPVCQYSLEGKFIRNFVSRVQASQFLGVDETALGAAVDKDNQSCGGYRWTTRQRELPPFHNQRRRAITCFDLNGNVVKRFSSSVEAALFAKGTEKSNITACCKSSIKTAGGYQWRYTENESSITSIKKVKKSGKVHPVCQLNPVTGKVIETFKSFQKAALLMGCNRNSIRLAAMGGGRCKGFRWSRLEI